MKLFTYLFGKGFTGGPDFSRLETFRFDLDGIDLQLTLPESNVPIPMGEIKLNRTPMFTAVYVLTINRTGISPPV